MGTFLLSVPGDTSNERQQRYAAGASTVAAIHGGAPALRPALTRLPSTSASNSTTKQSSPETSQSGAYPSAAGPLQIAPESVRLEENT